MTRLQVYPELYNIRLAISEAGLANGYLIYSWNLPEPTLPLYADYASRVGTAEGGLALRGFTSFTLQWNRLSVLQAYTLRGLVESALDSTGLLYATIDYGWSGVAASGTWVDVAGYPHCPALSPVGLTRAAVYDNVTLVVNNLTVVNNPADF